MFTKTSFLLMQAKLGSPLFCYNEDKMSMGNGKNSFGLVGIVVTVKNITWEKLQNMPEISPLDVPGKYFL